MSETDAATDNSDLSGLERVRQNRDALETLAEEDLPVARVARDLLDALEDAEG